MAVMACSLDVLSYVGKEVQCLPILAGTENVPNLVITDNFLQDEKNANM